MQRLNHTSAERTLMKICPSSVSMIDDPQTAAAYRALCWSQRKALGGRDREAAGG